MTIKPGEVPQADRVQIWLCYNPNCRKPHIFLFNENGEPFAQFIPPEGFLDDLIKLGKSEKISMAILSRLTKQLKAKGVENARQVAIETLTKSGSLIPGTTKMTATGIKRSEMGAAGRAIDRASKLSGKPASAYVYSKKLNRARLK